MGDKRRENGREEMSGEGRGDGVRFLPWEMTLVAWMMLVESVDDGLVGEVEAGGIDKGLQQERQRERERENQSERERE